jgi:hypothetical protein
MVSAFASMATSLAIRDLHATKDAGLCYGISTSLHLRSWHRVLNCSLLSCLANHNGLFPGVEISFNLPGAIRLLLVVSPRPDQGKEAINRKSGFDAVEDDVT